MGKRLAERVAEGLGEALAHARGEEVPGLRVHVPEPPAPAASIPETVDVRSIREQTGLSQLAFANRIGVPVGTLRGWEQNRRAPEGPARVLLALLARNPRVVEETLAR